MASVFQRALKIYSGFENAIINIFHFPFPSERLVPVFTNLPILQQDVSKTKSLKDLLKDAILWAVPKKRKSIERRRSQRFGYPDYVYKMIQPKTNILICTKCGSYHEAGLLCATCYNKIKSETEDMQEAIEKELGISPVETEVVVLYQGEKDSNPEFYQGKRVVEMKKERPKIFSNNLLQRSTQPPANTTEVIQSNKIS